MEQRNINSSILYYKDGMLTEFEANVVSCAPHKKGFAVVLDRTAFFPGGGGQERDEGTINGIPLCGMEEKDGEILHILPSPLGAGEKAACSVDRVLRIRRMQGHGGEHIFSGILKSRFGSENSGFHLGSGEVVTVDTALPLTRRQLEEAEYYANIVVAENLPITAFFITAEEAKGLEFRSKIEFEGDVRIVEISGVDRCACCAPHFSHTGAIGSVKILDAIPWRGGMRVTMVCGLAALEDYKRKLYNVKEISTALSAKPDETAEAVKGQIKKAEESKYLVSDLRRALREEKLAGIKATEKSICLFDELSDGDGLRDYVNLLLPLCGKVAAAFGKSGSGYIYAAASRTENMKDIAKAMNAALGGKGGGRDMIFGSVTASKEEIEEFFNTL